MCPLLRCHSVFRDRHGQHFHSGVPECGNSGRGRDTGLRGVVYAEHGPVAPPLPRALKVGAGVEVDSPPQRLGGGETGCLRAHGLGLLLRLLRWGTEVLPGRPPAFLGRLFTHPSPLAPAQQELSLKKRPGAEETKASLYHLPLSPGMVRSRRP